MKIEAMMINYVVRNSSNQILCGSRVFNNNQINKLVEAALYDYPAWKINSEQLHSQHNESIVELRNTVVSYNKSLEEFGVRRNDYISQINLIEGTMTVLSPLQQNFVEKRYFKKTPFKIIAEELAVTERHLYRIRKEVIRLFGVSFGWC